MDREDRKKQLIKAISRFRNFNKFRFEGGPPIGLEDDDILIIKEIGFPQTEDIEYQNNSLTAAGVKILCQAYPNAQLVDLSKNPLKDESIIHIAKLTEMRWLKLRDTNLGSLSMQPLREVQMKYLMEVQLNQNYIGNKGCQCLTQAVWPYLKSIFLTNCGIDDVGALHLSKAQWNNVETLYLMDNYLTRLGVSHLKKANWKKLKTFTIKNDNFRWWFRMIDFYPHQFHQQCNFSFKRLKPLMVMMSVSSRFNGYSHYH